MSDVFVSYASADREAAFRIVDYLESQGIRCWVAPRDVSPGMEYGEAIIDAIGRVRALVLVLSDHSNESTFVRKEVERAVSKTKPILPVRIREVKPAGALEFYISSAQWVDAWKSPLEQHLLPLVGAIRAMGDPALLGAGEGGAEAGAAAAGRMAGHSSSPPRSKQSLLVAAMVLVVVVALGAVLWMGRAPDSTRLAEGEATLALPDPGGSAGPPDTTPGSALPAATESATTPAPSPVNAPPAPAAARPSGPALPDRGDVAFFAGRWCEPYNGLTIVYDVIRTGSNTLLIRVDHPQAEAWDVPARILAIPGGFELQPADEAPTDQNVVRFQVVDDNLLTVVFANGAPEDGTTLRLRCTGREG
jgi:hypothetical protein